MPRARRGHRGREHLEASVSVCRIKNLCRRQWTTVACTSSDKHAAIGQTRCRMIYARGGEHRASGGGLRFRIKDFGNCDEVPGAVMSTGDQNAAIG